MTENTNTTVNEEVTRDSLNRKSGSASVSQFIKEDLNIEGQPIKYIGQDVDIVNPQTKQQFEAQRVSVFDGGKSDILTAITQRENRDAEPKTIAFLKKSNVDNSELKFCISAEYINKVVQNSDYENKDEILSNLGEIDENGFYQLDATNASISKDLNLDTLNFKTRDGKSYGIMFSALGMQLNYANGEVIRNPLKLKSEKGTISEGESFPFDIAISSAILGNTVKNVEFDDEGMSNEVLDNMQISALRIKSYENEQPIIEMPIGNDTTLYSVSLGKENLAIGFDQLDFRIDKNTTSVYLQRRQMDGGKRALKPCFLQIEGASFVRDTIGDEFLEFNLVRGKETSVVHIPLPESGPARENILKAAEGFLSRDFENGQKTANVHKAQRAKNENGEEYTINRLPVYTVSSGTLHKIAGQNVAGLTRKTEQVKQEPPIAPVHDVDILSLINIISHITNNKIEDNSMIVVGGKSYNCNINENNQIIVSNEGDTFNITNEGDTYHITNNQGDVYNVVDEGDTYNISGNNIENKTINKTYVENTTHNKIQNIVNNITNVVVNETTQQKEMNGATYIFEGDNHYKIQEGDTVYNLTKEGDTYNITVNGGDTYQANAGDDGEYVTQKLPTPVVENPPTEKPKEETTGTSVTPTLEKPEDPKELPQDDKPKAPEADKPKGDKKEEKPKKSWSAFLTNLMGGDTFLGVAVAVTAFSCLFPPLAIVSGAMLLGFGASKTGFISMFEGFGFGKAKLSKDELLKEIDRSKQRELNRAERKRNKSVRKENKRLLGNLNEVIDQRNSLVEKLNAEKTKVDKQILAKNKEYAEKIAKTKQAYDTILEQTDINNLSIDSELLSPKMKAILDKQKELKEQKAKLENKQTDALNVLIAKKNVAKINHDQAQNNDSLSDEERKKIENEYIKAKRAVDSFNNLNNYSKKIKKIEKEIAENQSSFAAQLKPEQEWLKTRYNELLAEKDEFNKQAKTYSDPISKESQIEALNLQIDQADIAIEAARKKKKEGLEDYTKLANEELEAQKQEIEEQKQEEYDIIESHYQDPKIKKAVKEAKKNATKPSNGEHSLLER